MKVLILDTETSGISATDQVIELAVFLTSLENFKDFTLSSESFIDFKEALVDETTVSRYKPTVPINQHAFNVHGIGLVALKDMPLAKDVRVPEKVDYIVGHNIAFDIRLLVQSNPNLVWLNDVPAICTMELARGIKKNLKIPLPSAKLSELTEYYYPEYKDFLLATSHTARGDVVNTILVLLAMLKHVPNIETWDELYQFQQTLKNVKKVK